MLHRHLSSLALAVSLTLPAAAVHAAATTDPIGDFIPSYTGSHNGDLDVLSAFVSYDPNANMFLFSGTMAADIGTTASAVYVFGLDRGQGTARFGSLASNVLFDAVVTLRPDGSGSVGLLLPAPTVTTVLPAGSVSFAGATITGRVSGALLVPDGVDRTAFTWNLWPRDQSQAGNAAISDFAPNNANLAVTLVPEPSTIALLGLGIGALVWRIRRQRVG